jgi:hypothetical protein
MATQLVEIAGEVELFHSPSNEAFAAVPIDGHREIWRLKDFEFRQWLAQGFSRSTLSPPQRVLSRMHLGCWKGKLSTTKKEREVFVRTARRGDAMAYISIWEI